MSRAIFLENLLAIFSGLFSFCLVLMRQNLMPLVHMGFSIRLFLAGHDLMINNVISGRCLDMNVKGK